MDSYVKHYNDHYLREGESGSGQLVWKPQFEIWKKAGYKKGMFVLDYGCGVGVMTNALDDDHYIGYDISEEAIRLARKKYPGYIFLVLEEMGDLVPNKMIDMCVAQSVFTHTPKVYVDRCLKDIKASFKDFAIIDILLGEDNPLDDHVRYYTEEEWLDCLWRNGLKGERIGEHDFVGYTHIFYRITHD